MPWILRKVILFFNFLLIPCSQSVSDHAVVDKSIKTAVPATVRIPYSLVPHIDFNSNSYQRALATLGKQVISDKADDKHKRNDDGKGSGGAVKGKGHNDTLHEFVSCSGSSNNDDVSSMELSASFLLFSSYFFINLVLFYLS